MLYVVATPIGNLGDMSPRAVDTLRQADLIAAEDTRHTMKLLTHFDIHTPLTSLHEHNEQGKSAAIVRRMLEEGIAVALVTDAGTPAVSDPGAILVREAAQAGVEVVAVPGPSAAVAAMSVSGFEHAGFAFYGFPPREKKALRGYLTALAGRQEAVILYESPRRAAALLQAVLDALGDVPVSLSCDLTKLHEKTLRGLASAVLADFLANDKAEKGEYVLVLDLRGTARQQEAAAPAAGLEARLLDLCLGGQGLQDAMAALVQQGERKNAVYAASLTLKGLLKDGALSWNEKNTGPQEGD